MGIPRLLQRFKDAGHTATAVVGDTSKPSDQDKMAIIDGPSLAHIIARSVKQSQHFGANVGTSSTYSETARQTIAWLDGLCSLGFTVNAIFFDGALPPSKRPVRLERLTAYARNLNNYKNLYDTAARTFSVQKSSEIWLASPLETARRNLAAEPFTVSAVFEGLLASSYADKVHLVPGEADSFCVAAARQLHQAEEAVNPFVFTSDSDLIVFDSGARTKIIYLHSVQSTAHEGKTVMTAETVHPSAVSLRLAVPNLLELAYWMEQDPYRSVLDAVSCIKKGDSLGPSFASFAEQYRAEHEITTLEMLQKQPSRRARLNRLDARAAELVHQLPPDTSQIHSYLPFLFEDPSKTSVFRNIGQTTRQTAYTILLQSASTEINPTIIEYHRSTTTITPISIPLLALPQLDTFYESILTHHTPEQWRHEILLMTLRDMMKADIPLPLPETILSTTPTSWEAIYFSAAVQATWYSLRMCRQILSWATTAQNTPRPDPGPALAKLRDLPSVSAFFSPPTDSAGVTAEAVERILTILETEHGTFRRVAPPVKRAGGKQEKRARRKKRKLDQSESRDGERGGREDRGSRNPFAVLETCGDE